MIEICLATGRQFTAEWWAMEILSVLEIIVHIFWSHELDQRLRILVVQILDQSRRFSDSLHRVGW